MIKTLNIKNRKPALFIGFIGLSLILFVFIAAFTFKLESFAVGVDEATKNYENAKTQLQSVTDEYNSIMKSADDMSQNINDTTSKALQTQNEILKCQEQLSKLISYEYKNGSFFDLTMLTLSSTSFNELLKNITYANSIIDYHTSLITQKQNAKEEFDSILDDLTNKYKNYETLINQATQKQNEAKNLVSSASITLDEAQAQALAEIENAKNKGNVDGGWNTGGHGSSGKGDVPTPTPSPIPSPEPIAWNSGIASAYGGSSDPTTPNPGITATGAICDDWSMGVAVPMAWTNYRQFFNHAVKIKYNGMTVLATVNDCGYMGAGARSLDLQPGVFKAFGFNTCNSWGLRQVEFQIL